MLSLMFETEELTPSVKITFSKEASSEELLFIEVLNEILFIQDAHTIAASSLTVDEIKSDDSQLRAICTLSAEPFTDALTVKTEVKAATYSGLKYEIKESEHMLQCILDV